MAHATPLISTIVVGLVLAFIFGAIANRFRLPPLVGYLVAGIIVGPNSPGFVADVEIANELSEIGIILLMFGVGLNFSLKDLMSVQAVAIPGSLGRIVLGTLMGMALAWALGWSLMAGIIFGLALSVASTIVLLKAFQDRHLLDSDRGRIAVGWVIVEDIAMVLALVLIPAFAELAGADTAAVPSDPFVSFVERLAGGDIGVGGAVAVTVIKLAAFVGFMFVVGRRLIPMVLHFTAHTGSRELFRLAVLAIALGVAAGSAYLFGVSLALGAFFAGMILSESELSHRAAQETLPLRDAFSVLFFVAVGMLFDPMVLVTHPLPVLATLFIILVAKTVVGYFLIVIFQRPIGTALTVSAGVAQIGEFSFILATLGITLGILPEEGRDLILAGAIISIILNPAMFWLADILRPRLEERFPGHAHLAPVEAATGTPVEPEIVAPSAEPAPAVVPPEEEDEHGTALTAHTILAGYGRVGTVIGEGLLAAGIPFVLIEDAEGRVAAARRAGIEVIEGNAATSRALALANVEGATTIIIAIPNAFEAGQATEQSRKHNPAIRIVARAHSDEEETHLTHLGADVVVMGEREIGLGMLELLHDPRADAVADSYKHDDDVPAVVSDVPNPQPAAPHATMSPIEAAVLGEVLDEEPLPSDGELTDDDAEAMTEAEEAEDLRVLDGPAAAELEAEIQPEEEPDLWDDAEPEEMEPPSEDGETVEPTVPPVVLPPDADEDSKAKDPVPEPKL